MVKVNSGHPLFTHREHDKAFKLDQAQFFALVQFSLYSMGLSLGLFELRKVRIQEPNIFSKVAASFDDVTKPHTGLTSQVDQEFAKPY